MSKKIVAIIIIYASLGLLIGIYFLFLQNAPPFTLDNRYLLDTHTIKVYGPGKNPGDTREIRTITDDKKIRSIIENLKFKKLPSGRGLVGATDSSLLFISDKTRYFMFFNKGDHRAEIFFPEIELNKWDKWNIVAGTITPVYILELNQNLYNSFMGD